MSAQANNLEILLGELDLDIGESEIIVQTPGTYSALRLGKCAFLFAPNTKANFRVDDGLAVRVVHLLQGALHSVFDPEAVAERAVITRHATIAIRGTALYTELDEEKNRTCTCCCYGRILIETSSETEMQRAAYHSPRVINSSGQIDRLSGKGLNHHSSENLNFLEKSVGRRAGVVDRLKYILPR